MKHIDEKDLEELKNRLLEEKETLKKRLSKLGNRLPDSDDWVADYGKIEPTPDENEASDRLEDMAEKTSTLSELEIRWNNVKGALKKIESGTYGICEETGEEIEIERLKANPAAKTAIVDKEE